MRRKKIQPAHELDLLEWEPSVEDLRRFFSKIKEEDGHWLWLGGLDKNGYPYFHLRGSSMAAYRFSYALFKGLIPRLRQVHHKDICRIHCCVNPSHLSLLSQRKNSQEARKFQLENPSLF